MENGTKTKADPKSSKRQINWIELLSTTVLSIAAIATAWTSYQAAKWSGEQRILFMRASAIQIESVRSSLDGNQKTVLDIVLFNEWLKAINQEDERLANFYFDRMGDLQPAVEAWVDTKPLENPAAPNSPFIMEEYTNIAYEDAEQQLEQASEWFEKGMEAGQISDKYILNVVILASVLFFAGVATHFKNEYAQIFLIASGTVWLVVGLYNIVLSRII